MQSDKVKISVIVPCYNVEKYIARCLESLINQDIEQSYEIVVVNDGTKDNSAVIAQEYADRYSDKVRVLHKQNGGLSSARNYGIKHSDSEYLAFVDSDDYVASNFLSTLYKTIITERCDIAMCGAIRTYDSYGSGVKSNMGFQSDCVITDRSMVAQSSNAAWNKMYLRNLFDEITFPEGINFEDYATIPRVMCRADKIVYKNIPLYFYYYNPDSILNSMKKKVDINIFKAHKILAASEIKSDEDLMASLYLKMVILSLSRRIVEVTEDRQLFNDLICYCKSHYPSIKNCSYSRCLSIFEIMLFRAFLSNSWYAMKLLVVGRYYFTCLYSFVKRNNL